ncbi:putative ubiquitin-conjugating enzyme morgue [Operophtera brumata]|uniref:Putative ubiquitin-conjugating enzyme morgue n=1 Tax=Operophtera brumata TaxID=104452 RepID=A0A0L7K3H8_OPEBR|nr:putative ubiquitin-conjugating enzyme morgue [Operophtera brumata]
MSAIGPQFYEFMKKLDENSGKLPTSITARTFQPEFEFNNSTCYLCNGYYGPSFGEPVCVTCHEFLFPDIPHHLPNSYILSEKTEDGDSGNDEPSVGELMYNDRRLTRALQQQGIPNWAFKNSLDSETSPEDPFISISGELLNRPSNSGHNPGGSNSGGPNYGGSTSAGPNGGDPNAGSPNGGDPNGGGPNGGRPSHDDGPAVPDDEQPRPLPSSLARSLAALYLDDLAGTAWCARAWLSRAGPPSPRGAGRCSDPWSPYWTGIRYIIYDLSLCACALVCARWHRLVRTRVAQPRWAAFATRRWPLFRTMVTILDWHKKYQSLVESCFCRNCVVQMCMQLQPPFEENAWRRNRLRIEIKMLRNTPPEGCAATPLDPKCCHWQAMVTGPVGSPYEGGVFYLYIQVPYS